MARISLRNIEKWYGDVQVLKDCSLEIKDHEFIVLVGPSGSGKTTLLRIIAGLEHTSGGDLFFDDVCVNDVDVGDRDIAMVFQNYGLYPHMSVYDNMAFGLRRRKLAKEEIDKRVRRAAGMLNIEPFLARRPRQLSGGQRQRVALGRAIVRDPAVFLLDEPLSNLDAHLRVQMRAEILKVHRAVDATAVYVTHDQVEALTMGDRIVVMNDGRIHQVGTPDELYDAPVNKFVASFIGTPAMGFLTCRIERSHGTVGLVSDSARMRLSEQQSRALDRAGSEAMTVGIRPERLTLASGKETDAEVVIHGTVEVVEMLGAEQYVHFAADGGSLTARVPRDQPVKVDQRVTFTSRSHHLHMFDHETGLALSHRAEQERVF
jgi:multiple sugar transport system ATP-binding protein